MSRAGLRIIAGELRGRRIPVPPGDVRPTGERAREALFAILGARVAGARVLDAYSGSGALGFEAISRGAAELVLAEADRGGLAFLRASAAALGIDQRCRFVPGRVVEGLVSGALCGSFDLILADPPYEGAERARFLPAAAGVLAPGGLVVLERDSRHDPVEAAPGEPCRVRSADYGRNCFDFYRLPAPGPGARLGAV